MSNVCMGCNGTGKKSYLDQGHGGDDYFTSTCNECKGSGFEKLKLNPIDWKARAQAAESKLAKYEAAEQGMPEVPRWDISGDADRWPDSLAENGEHVKYEDFDKYRSWAVATVAGLREEIAEWEKRRNALAQQDEDAERYRYLRSEQSRDHQRHSRRTLTAGIVDWDSKLDPGCARRSMWSQANLTGEALDTAIDAARQAPVAKSGKEGEC